MWSNGGVSESTRHITGHWEMSLSRQLTALALTTEQQQANIHRKLTLWLT